MSQDTAPNPYQIPDAKLTTPVSVPPLRRVPASHGVNWLVSALALWRQRPGLFIGMTLLMGIINFALGMLPLVGLLASLFTPALLGGFALAAYKVEHGQRADVGDLFAGFKQNFSQLVVVGAIFLGTSFGLMIVGGILIGICIALGFDLDSGLSPGLLILGFMGLMLVMLLIMMVFITMSYAAMIVMLGNLEPTAAYKQAFNAFLVNFMPFLVFGVVSSLLYGLCMLPLILGFIDSSALIGAIVLTLGLFLLVASPWMTLAIYTGVKDMFGEIIPAPSAGAGAEQGMGA